MGKLQAVRLVEFVAVRRDIPSPFSPIFLIKYEARLTDAWFKKMLYSRSSMWTISI